MEKNKNKSTCGIVDEGNSCCSNTANSSSCTCKITDDGSCVCKTTDRSDDERKKLINRLNRIEGQIRGIRAMVERNAYCPDILVQSSAVTSAVNSFNRELVAAHIHSCVVRDVREGNEEVIDELVATLQKLMK